jgi:hypothetical protein
MKKELLKRPLVVRILEIIGYLCILIGVLWLLGEGYRLIRFIVSVEPEHTWFLGFLDYIAIFCGSFFFLMGFFSIAVGKIVDLLLITAKNLEVRKTKV